MTPEHTDTESVEFNDDGQLWAAGPMELSDKLERYYGVDSIYIIDSYYNEETGARYDEAMTYWDGDEKHLLKEYLPIFGHGPSGAVGVDREDLPTKEHVKEVVQSD